MNKKAEYFISTKMQELAKACRLNGLPLTPQRRAILETLAGRKDHPSADELFDEVKARFEGISRTTVYRVLDTLVKIGVVQKINTHEARARFDADTTRHHHLLCIGCGMLGDLGEWRIDDLSPDHINLNGFRLMDFSIQFTGLCAECLAGAEPTGRRARPLPTTAQGENMKKWRCTICDYIHEGPEPPDTCPECGAGKENFEAVEE